ncbi:MAG TPA: ATP-binding cassette domain-containing protein [Steroidobacteraceae bacterium]|nr:ATP-binding cassette domain-containing protein [Steroidobacteraceae bacterium]
MRRPADRNAQYVEVRLRNLQLRRHERLVLEGIDWTLRPGQRWVLAGGNGAGKTQLLKIIAGAVWPTSADESRGRFNAMSRSSRGGRRSERSETAVRRYRWRGETFDSPYEVKEEIGYIGPERQDKYERYGWNHTVEQIVGTGLYRTDIPLDPLRPADRRRIATLLRRLAIAPLAGRRFLSLSYGERRLTLLARTLAARPRMLLLDELLAGLDPVNHARALSWLRGTSRADLPWVLSTHRLEDIPSSATHALVLESGRVVYRGPLRKARLARWLDARGPDAPAPQAIPMPARSRHRPGRLLIKLTHASVYLDEHPILEGLTFTVLAAECWIVHGRNGSGKSTLLRTLYGDHAVASGGRIERAGIQPGVPLWHFQRRVGLVAPHLQSDHPQDLTVAAVVQSGRRASIGLNNAPSAADRAAARRSLEFFGLADLAPRTLRELSYGQLRRVLFARAWVCRPALLLLDEPFSGVDSPTRLGLMHQIQSLVAAGTAVVMTTHHPQEWPACTTHEIELRGGRPVYCGPVRSSAVQARVAAGGKS